MKNNQYITLTNASRLFKDTKIAINKDIIVSIFENTETDEEGNTTKTTGLYSNTDSTWHVVESFDDVLTLFNS